MWRGFRVAGHTFNGNILFVASFALFLCLVNCDYKIFWVKKEGRFRAQAKRRTVAKGMRSRDNFMIKFNRTKSKDISMV